MLPGSQQTVSINLMPFTCHWSLNTFFIAGAFIVIDESSSNTVGAGMIH
jgi:sulfate adenylyltransferase subunit 1 (EFTu-like GTPase family)